MFNNIYNHYILNLYILILFLIFIILLFPKCQSDNGEPSYCSIHGDIVWTLEEGEENYAIAWTDDDDEADYRMKWS